MKIALVGSAPTSLQLAPYADPTWEIWGCSPGLSRHIPRVSAWFELHPITPSRADFEKDYLLWLSKLDAPVYVIDKIAGLPSSVQYPREEMEAKYGPYFFTSTVAWMLALALEKDPEEIGLYGIDMAASEEYSQQRPGCHHFMEIAKARGIKITVPPQSDLLEPPPPYGFCETNRIYVRLESRLNELVQRINAAEQARANAAHEITKLSGAASELRYMLNTYGGKE